MPAVLNVKCLSMRAVMPMGTTLRHCRNVRIPVVSGDRTHCSTVGVSIYLMFTNLSFLYLSLVHPFGPISHPFIHLPSVQPSIHPPIHITLHPITPFLSITPSIMPLLPPSSSILQLLSSPPPPYSTLLTPVGAALYTF